MKDLPRMPTLISDEDWPEDIAEMLPGFAGKLNVYRMMAHNPQLLAAWKALRNHVVLESRLTPQQSEIVILRTGWRRASRYEWMHHVSRGRKVGLSDDAIQACARDPAHAEPEHRLFIEIVDALIDHPRLPPALLQRAISAIGAPALLDVMATIGMYGTLACIVETFEVPVDADILAELTDHPLAAFAHAPD